MVCFSLSLRPGSAAGIGALRSVPGAVDRSYSIAGVLGNWWRAEVAHLHRRRPPPRGSDVESASSARFHVTLQKPRDIPYEVFCSYL